MSTAPAAFAIAVATNSCEIAALAEEWDALEAATPEATGFQSYAWCRSWIAARNSPPGVFRIVTLRDAGRLAMLWPLQLDRQFGARVLRWLGEPMTQYGDALALASAARPAWRAAIEAEIHSWRDVDLVALTRLRADGALCGAGLQPTAQGEALAAPFADLAAPKASRRRNKSAERRERRLAAIGGVELEGAASPERRLDFVGRALAWKRLWLKSRFYPSAGLSSQATPVFLERLALNDALDVHALRVGSRIVAIEIGLLSGGAYRALIAGYDPHYAAGAPGHALTRRLIAHYAARGLATYDFLAPDDPYKRAYASGATPLVAHFSPRTRLGCAVGFALARLRPAVKRMVWTFARLQSHVRAGARRIARAVLREGASHDSAIGENFPDGLRRPAGAARRPR